MSETPILLWIRRDLRLNDHPALRAAADSGRPVIPVFIHDEVVEGLGAAAKWRFGLGVAKFAETLEGIGSRLVLRRGRALEVLRALIEETGAGAVWWARAYDPDSKDRDTRVKEALRDDGFDVRSFAGHLLFEPWTIETQDGGYYKVYSPFWRNVKDQGVGAPLAGLRKIRSPGEWPGRDDLDGWDMGAAMRRGAAVVAGHVCVGEEAAQDRLEVFLEDRVPDYKEARDFPARAATSGLSENLTYGEISPRTTWHAGQRALQEEGGKGAEHFLKELVWREFAYHLVHHTPRIVRDNWREEWDGFPWNEDERLSEVIAWKRGRTGVPFVDAAMREMYVTGTMHNRARMIVASYLTKHLMCHWRIGLDWFADHLIDWDPASNALGWQWTAGSGPDAAPYFRVFNPVTQAEKFDGDGTYRRRWLAEPYDDPSETALSYFDAIPRHWRLAPDQDYPKPVVGLKEGRERALEAYRNRDG